MSVKVDAMGKQCPIPVVLAKKALEGMTVPGTLEVLVDGFDEDAEQFYGRTYADSPDIDGRVWIACDEPLTVGDFVQVTIDAVEDGDLCGYVAEE